MLNITPQQGNTNQNHTEIKPHARVAKMNKSGDYRCWRDCGDTGTLFAVLVGMQTGAAPLENSVEIPQKINNRTTLRPSNSTARNLSKGYRSADS